MASMPPFLILTSLVLVSWEFFVHLLQDVEYLRARGWYRRPVIWAYFIQRYGAIVETTARAPFLGHFHSHCREIGLVARIAGGVFVLPSISFIYLYRVLAIWNKRREIKYTLIILWVVVFGASMTAPFSQTVTDLPEGGCTIIRDEDYTPASFIANAVYDIVVFVLTLIKLGTHRHQYKHFHSPLQTILLRDGVLYFAVSIVLGITNSIFLLAFKSSELATSIIPLHIALASIMTTRLVNNAFRVVTNGVDMTVDFNFPASGPINNGHYMQGSCPGAMLSKAKVTNHDRAGDRPTFVIGSGVGIN